MFCQLPIDLDGNPSLPDNSLLPPPSISLDNGDLVFDFSLTRRTSPLYDLVPEDSGNLNNNIWYSGAPYIESLDSVDNPDGTTTDTYRARASNFGTDMLFVLWNRR